MRHPHRAFVLAVKCRCWTEWTENQIRASSGNGCKCLIQERYVARTGGLEFLTFWLPRQTVKVKFTLIKSFKFKEWCARGTRTPDLLVRSHKSKNANCPIWRRLRTGNAILHSISCTQSCTQNRIISNLHRMSSIRKAEFGHAVTASPATPVSDCLCIICAVASCGLAFELGSWGDL